MKSDVNVENDVAIRRGSSAVYHSEKSKKSMQSQLNNEETKNATLDFIFGRSETNPIIRDKNNNIQAPQKAKV